MSNKANKDVEELFRNNAPARFIGEKAEGESDLLMGLELAQEKHDLGQVCVFVIGQINQSILYACLHSYILST